jgi:IclR family pca regulon transcriptional regulator
MSNDEKSNSGKGSADLVKSLLKGLAVIEAFDGDDSAMTLSEVAKKTGFTRAGARRLLLTLVSAGYARQDGSDFSLTPRILKLGYAYLSSLGLWDVAEPLMRELVDEISESCSAAVLDGADVVYVARVPSPKRIMSIKIDVGTRLPAHATSMGRVLLSAMTDAQLSDYLDQMPWSSFTEHTITDPIKLAQIIKQTQLQGWALVDQELEMGLRSISVPIFDNHGRVKAALNISTHVSRYTDTDIIDTILPALKGCAERVSLYLGKKMATLPN